MSVYLFISMKLSYTLQIRQRKRKKSPVKAMNHLRYTCMGWAVLEIGVEKDKCKCWNVLISWVSLSQCPRDSSRSESEWIFLKYCFTSAWLLSSFPDFSVPSRVLVNVYWFTTYAGIFFVFFLLLHLSRSALVCDISIVLNCFLSCTFPYLSTMLERW